MKQPKTGIQASLHRRDFGRVLGAGALLPSAAAAREDTPALPYRAKTVGRVKAASCDPGCFSALPSGPPSRRAADNNPVDNAI